MTVRGLLETIVAARREAVRPLSARREELRKEALAAPPPRPFAASLREGREVALIAEVKRASPSRGVLRRDLDPARLALAYQRGGARAVSVLVEERFFLGGEEDFRRVREAVDLPLLWKDFILTPEQVYLSRSRGADACLLIARLLSPEELSSLLSACREVGMEALVEVHGEADLELALSMGAQLVGINNRDLESFQVDPGVAGRLAPLVPPSVTLVGESGIRSRQDVERLARAGVDACLVGEALVVLGEEELGARLRELASVPRCPRVPAARRLFSPGRVAVKICGLSRPEEVRAAREAGADFCGFVFWPSSRRAVTPEEAREMAREAGGLRKVGVFVDAPYEEVAEIARRVPLDAVQLHGREDPDYVVRLRRALPGVGLIKAFGAEGEPSGVVSLERAPEYAGLVDACLVDSGRGAPGGTGGAFDWSVAGTRPLPRPLFLAGGLTPENVGEALSSLRPEGVDVSSGVEREGRKDPRLIRHFVEEVRRWERGTPGPM